MKYSKLETYQFSNDFFNFEYCENTETNFFICNFIAKKTTNLSSLLTGRI